MAQSNHKQLTMHRISRKLEQAGGFKFFRVAKCNKHATFFPAIVGMPMLQ
jgi:hypothetical protein